MPSFLIVDDEQPVAATLSRMLTLAGHQVECAYSAQAGLASAARNRPDAMLVDLRMPEISGIEFLRRVRADPYLREIPIALVTGDYFLDEALLSEIHALGATVRYKPLWLDDVIALANTLVHAES